MGIIRGQEGLGCLWRVGHNFPDSVVGSRALENALGFFSAAAFSRSHVCGRVGVCVLCSEPGAIARLKQRSSCFLAGKVGIPSTWAQVFGIPRVLGTCLLWLCEEMLVGVRFIPALRQCCRVSKGHGMCAGNSRPIILAQWVPAQGQGGLSFQEASGDCTQSFASA